MILSPSVFKNPINQTKSTDAADAFDKPILTLASLRRGVTNVQTNGLPTDNKSSLGLYRFPGNDVGPLSAGIGQPAIPPVPPTFKPKEVNFMTTGNNVYQPDRSSASLATNALLKRLGEQKFKAKENEPYAAYVAQMKLEREVAEAEKGASVGDLNLAREILRSAMAERRKQNEDDYLRKLLDSGMTAEDAQDELEEVRRANALQESRKVDDRAYQSKLLLVNLAKKRGLLSSVNEPLTQSAPIMSPSPSDATATAMGDASQGFGNAPLDVNRQFLTPEYYGRFMRKSRMTEEDADRQMAMNNLIANGEAGQFQTPLMLEAKKREIAMENVSETLANNLSAIRRRAITEPLPPAVFAPEIYRNILKQGMNKEPFNTARMTERSFEDMTAAQLIVALNRLIVEGSGELSRLKTIVNEQLEKEKYTKNDLIVLAKTLTTNENGKTVAISLPFRIPDEQITKAVRDYRTIVPAEHRMEIRRWLGLWEEMTQNLDAEPKASSKPAGDEKKNAYFANVGAVPERGPKPAKSLDGKLSWTLIDAWAKYALVPQSDLPMSGSRGALPKARDIIKKKLAEVGL